MAALGLFMGLHPVSDTWITPEHGERTTTAPPLPQAIRGGCGPGPASPGLSSLRVRRPATPMDHATSGGFRADAV